MNIMNISYNIAVHVYIYTNTGMLAHIHSRLHSPEAIGVKLRLSGGDKSRSLARLRFQPRTITTTRTII